MRPLAVDSTPGIFNGSRIFGERVKSPSPLGQLSLTTLGLWGAEFMPSQVRRRLMLTTCPILAARSLLPSREHQTQELTGGNFGTHSRDVQALPRAVSYGVC